MPRIASAIWLTFSLILSVSGLSAHARSIDLPQVHILADPSLMLPLTHIARNYSRNYHVAITTSFASNNEQKERITQGMEADIFITTRNDTLKDLKNQGLVDVYSQHAIARNRLVIATLADNPLELILIRNLPMASILSKQSGIFTFAIGDPEYQSVGTYSLEALRNFNLAIELEPYFLFLRSPVNLHKAIAADRSYGIMLQSDVARDRDIKKLDVFPEDTHSPIIYQAVVVASKHMEDARKFMEHLTSADALATLKEYGFEAP